MPTQSRDVTIRTELERVREALESERPELADRLARVVERLPSEPGGDYISTGVAATLLGVSANTVKKWVRTGVIREFWTMPGSGYLKIARSEVDRLKTDGAPSHGSQS